jgi:hypothetical protein
MSDSVFCTFLAYLSTVLVRAYQGTTISIYSQEYVGDDDDDDYYYYYYYFRPVGPPQGYKDELS